ncbi:MAG: hypothetical protein JKX70_01885 [Phycisphaerales bacterium]|nr:hypothetical protein [Phycisphaerales bacterium]
MSKKDIVAATSEAITGLLGRDKNENFVSVSKVVQATIKNHGFEQLKEEWEKLKQEGKIADEYVASEACRDRFARVCRYFDSDFVDPKAIELMRRIFINASVLNNQEDILPAQYIDLVSNLEVGEISILVACYKQCCGQGFVIDSGAVGYAQWSKEIACLTGLRHQELVDQFCRSLINKGLLNQRVYADSSGFNEYGRGGLSSFGMALLQYSFQGS